MSRLASFLNYTTIWLGASAYPSYTNPSRQRIGKQDASLATECEKAVRHSCFLFGTCTCVSTHGIFSNKSKGIIKRRCFFRQERIGRQGIPFRIIKFRTMYESENEYQNHHLTEVNDKRVTPIGKIMRKYRLDELPQLCNVVKGDMSLVGYRPEQQYFIEKIIEKAPYYSLVHKVKPGITSWGMVKYGYANTVDKMIERLNYDIIYLENISILLDTKILIYTIKTIVSGKGL